MSSLNSFYVATGSLSEVKGVVIPSVTQQPPNPRYTYMSPVFPMTGMSTLALAGVSFPDWINR